MARAGKKEELTGRAREYRHFGKVLIKALNLGKVLRKVFYSPALVETLTLHSV